MHRLAPKDTSDRREEKMKYAATPEFVSAVLFRPMVVVMDKYEICFVGVFPVENGLEKGPNPFPQTASGRLVGLVDFVKLLGRPLGWWSATTGHCAGHGRQESTIRRFHRHQNRSDQMFR